MRNVALALLLASVTTAAALAQPGPASHDPDGVQPGAYQVDPNHTQVLFSVSHMGFSLYSGRFSGVTGTLAIDPRQPAASRLDVTIPVASVSTTSDKLDGELRSAQWLDADRFPQMRFRATRVARWGRGLAVVRG